MQPLYDIGLAAGKCPLEVSNGKAEKDRLLITQGNDAANYFAWAYPTYVGRTGLLASSPMGF